MIKRLATYYLLFSVVLSVLYVPVYKHTCLIFNKSDVSLFAADSCCSSCPEDESINTSCCSNKVEIYALEEDSTSPVPEKFELTKVLSSLVIPILTVPRITSINAPTPKRISESPQKIPDVLDYLASIQVYRL